MKREGPVKNSTIMIVGIFCLTLAAGMPGAYAEAECSRIQAVAEDIDSDPSAFEGDSESLPGERAPENLPMDDAPVMGGVGIE